MAPLLKRKSSDPDKGKLRPERKFIDLSDFNMPDNPENERMQLKVAEIRRFEDITRLGEHLYNGDILILDCTSVASDDLQMRRIVQEVRSMGRDIDGDVAGITKNLIVITPRGVAINRNRIRGSF